MLRTDELGKLVLYFEVGIITKMFEERRGGYLKNQVYEAKELCY